MIKNLFTPDELLEKFEDFDAKKYVKEGYTTILLDIDNTLEPETTPYPSKLALKRLKYLKDSGLRIIIYSNNTTKRVETFCKDLDVKWYAWSFKPLFYTYLRIFKDFKLKKNEVLTLGDQLMTDCLGSKKFGLKTIIIRPLSSDQKFYTKFNRMIERFIYKHVIHM